MTSWLRIVIGTLLVALVAVLAVLVHVQVNYPPEVRELVRGKAVSITVVVAVLISAFVFHQMRRTHELAVELQRLLNRDRLTDVATRDYFFDRLERMIDSAGAILVVDIDCFKSVNDTYGHLAGDVAIRTVAAHLKAGVRDVDIVCRFGGEEFVLFLPGLSASAGIAVAERVRETTAGTQIAWVDSPFYLTISVGVAVKAAGQSVDEAIKIADGALYLAKHKGRNRVVFSEKGRATAPLGKVLVGT